MIVILTPGAVTGLRKDDSNHESTRMDTDDPMLPVKAWLDDSRKTAALDQVFAIAAGGRPTAETRICVKS